jgi:hypothetical protein
MQRYFALKTNTSSYATDPVKMVAYHTTIFQEKRVSGRARLYSDGETKIQ